MARPNLATVQNETRHCDSCKMTAPSSGPTMGAMPPTQAIAWDPDQPRSGGEVDDDRAADHHRPAAGEACTNRAAP
jgi:hypothetical protein